MILVRQLFTDHRTFTTIVLLFIVCSSIALGVNATYFHYPGNYYYPKQTPWILMILSLIYGGLCLQYGKDSPATQKIREILFLFLSMALIIIGCTAIQYTPFPPIDKHILEWGQWMHIDLAKLVPGSSTHPTLYHCMDVLYESLAYQMTYLPLLLILFGHFKRMHEYYFLLLLTAFIGYAFYYFFPTTAPASVIDSPYFTEAQRATGLKFAQIHAHIKPSTYRGGMVAFPSFHVIWAWLCAYLIRDWRFAFALLLTLNTAIAFSCVLLGWHYILDVIASIAVLGMAHYTYFKFYPTTGKP